MLGEGPPDLIFLAEWWNDIELMWDEPLISDVLERFASFSRLICLDRRGLGVSDALPSHQAPVLDDFLDDVRAVMSAVESERAVLVGCSGGGPLSILFAATHPERVQSLVLVNSYARFQRAPDYPAGLPPDLVPAALERIEADWGSGALLDVLAPTLANDEYMRRWWARYQRHALTPGGAVVVQRMLFSIDLREVLPTIYTPTLVLHRTDNRFIRVAHGRYLADHLPDARLVELSGEDHIFFAGDTSALVDEIEAFVAGNRRGPQPGRVLTTMLFTDIVGSTTRAAELGDGAWRTVLARHDALVRESLARYRGREVNQAGDGFFATFDGPARAVACALRISEAVRELGLNVRAGVHTGEIEVRGDGVSGLAVHAAARVASLANADEVLVTSTVRDLVAGSGFEFEDRGRHELKGVPDAWQVYAVASR